MFWIYGGALEFGNNAVPAYDGTSFATNQDVILVSINYRTNGWFPTPKLNDTLLTMCLK
jgi:carboxylesterase type B